MLFRSGYRNNYGLDEKISSKAFANRLAALLSDMKSDDRAKIYALFDNAETISSARAQEILATVEKEFMQPASAADQATHARLESESKNEDGRQTKASTHTVAAKNTHLTRGEAYMLLMNWFRQTKR